MKGWRGCSVVKKVAGQPVGSSTMLGAGAMEQTCSARKCGRGTGGARKGAGWVMGLVWQREGSGQERLQMVGGSVGSTRKAGW